MTRLCNTAVVAIAIAAALAAACGDEHIEDCEGGLFITVTVDTGLLSGANELYVSLTTATGVVERTWPSSELASGSGTALVHFPGLTEATMVAGYAELRGTSGVIATASDTTTVQPVDTGCFPMSLSLGVSDADAGAGIADAAVNQPDADPAAPDAGVPDAAVDPPDADPNAPDAAIYDAAVDDAFVPPPDAGTMPDAMVDAMEPTFDDGGIVVPPDDGGIVVPPDDGGMAADWDFDGVPDITDNCWMDYNPFQENEDGDQYGNVCDNCPGLSNNTQINLDFDDIGDDCDPHPNDPTTYDAWIWFDGFDDQATLMDFVSTGGSWAIIGGALRQQSTTGIAMLGYDYDAFSQAVTVQTSVQPTDINMVASSHRVGTILGTNGAFTSGWGCYGNLFSDQLEVFSYFGAAQLASTALPFDVGDVMSVVSRFEPSTDVGHELRCSFGFTTLTPTDALQIFPDSIHGFYTESTSARFSYIFIIETFDNP